MLTFQEFCEKADHLKRILFNPSYRFESLGTRGFYNNLSDEEYLKRMFKARKGYELDLSNPQTFNEKIQWLKLYDHNPLYTTMVDKYAVKEYVASIIGEQYIIPTLGVWNRFEDIEFDLLPNQFVLKCTHDSGGVVIVKDKSKFNLNAARKKLNQSLKRNYYYFGREWPYKGVKPRIIAEQYLTDESGIELKDYKIHVFNGIPKLIQIDFDRFSEHKRNIYNCEWEYIDLEIRYPTDSNKKIKRPEKLEEMLQVATHLSNRIPYIRVDLYSVFDEILFGELTFYHGSGYERIIPEAYDYEMGTWIHLPSTLKREV